ncbi:MAG: nuclear transport factor 2 family protein [Stackebrandtia sp.]
MTNISDSEATRVAVAEFLRRSALGDPEEIAACYAPRVDWRVSWPVAEHPAVPWIRPRTTRADVADHYRTFPKHCEGEVAVHGIDVDGGHAVVTGLSSQRVPATGRSFSMRFALRLTIVDGLITEHHMYEDSQAVLAAFTT